MLCHILERRYDLVEDPRVTNLNGLAAVLRAPLGGCYEACHVGRGKWM